jgi:NAD(P)-dependent dehydrogenase (short-subunit alcohol dehydrogenase family)
VSRLLGKVVVVTGAASGIGLAAVKAFAREGADVLAVDVQGGALEAAVAGIGQAEGEGAPAGRVVPFVADVTDEAAVAAAMRKAAAEFGGLDIVIANAGIFGRHAFIKDCPLDSFDRVMRVNVTGVVATIKHAIPYLIERGGGAIIITSSVGAVLGNPGSVAYAASKHALTAVMKVAAVELAPYKIRVNTVNPGLVDTPMIHAIEADLAPGDRDKGRAILQDATLLKRYVSPAEVAELMLFLAADTGGFCTGGMYMIDGGMQYCLQHD